MLYPLVDTPKNGEQITHVEPEEWIARIRLVNDEHTSRPEHSRDLTARRALLRVTAEVMQHPNCIDEVDTAVGKWQVERAAGYRRQPGCAGFVYQTVGRIEPNDAVALFAQRAGLQPEAATKIKTDPRA